MYHNACNALDSFQQSEIPSGPRGQCCHKDGLQSTDLLRHLSGLSEGAVPHCLWGAEQSQRDKKQQLGLCE